MRCLPFCHRWQLRGVHPIRDVSFGEPGESLTKLLLACANCPKVKTRTLRGDWTHEQLAGQFEDSLTRRVETINEILAHAGRVADAHEKRISSLERTRDTTADAAQAATARLRQIKPNGPTE